LDDFLINSAWG